MVGFLLLKRRVHVKEKEISEVLQDFLNYIDQCKIEHEAAEDKVRREDRRLQDLLHELEFAENREKRNKVATKFQQSRKERRRQKDELMRRQLIVDFFNEPQNKKVLNNLRQLLGRQRTQEEFLSGKREYKPRVKE